MNVRQIFITSSIVIVAAILLLGFINSYFFLGFIVVAPLIFVGLLDITQKKQTIRRNFPIIGNFRYMLEKVRPEIMQYFVETDTEGRPINRLFRSVIYQRAKKENSTSPFGTQWDVYHPGYEWIDHSIYAANPADLEQEQRVFVGGRELTGGSIYTTSFSNPTKSDSTGIRIDHNLSKNFTLFGRYSDAPSYGNIRDRSNPSSFQTLTQNTQTLTLGATQVFSSKLVNEVRANYSRDEGFANYGFDGYGGGVLPSPSIFLPDSTSNLQRRFTFNSITNVSTGGVTFGDVAKNQNRQVQLIDNISYILGSHQLKFGADLRRLKPITAPNDLVVSNVGNTLQSVYNNVLPTFLALRQTQYTSLFRTFSFYGQDTWKVNKRLTLTYGLRWEINPSVTGLGGPKPLTFATPPDLSQLDQSSLALAPIGTPYYKTRYTNFAPRFGVSYLLSQKPGRELIVRGGVGVFYDLGQTGFGLIGFPYNLTVIQSNVPLPVPASFTIFSPVNFTPSPTNRGSITVAAPDYTLPRTYQWNLRVEQSLGKDQTLSVAYVGAAGRKLVRARTVNFAASSATPNTFFIPNFSGATLIDNADQSDYNSMQAQFTRHLSRGLQAVVSYTWSHSIDNGSNDNGLAAPGYTFDQSFFQGDSVLENMSKAVVGLCLLIAIFSISIKAQEKGTSAPSSAPTPAVKKVLSPKEESEGKLSKSLKNPQEYVNNLGDYLNKYPYSERARSYAYSLRTMFKDVKDSGEVRNLINQLIKNTDQVPSALKIEVYRYAAEGLFNKGLFEDSATLAQKTVDSFDDASYLEYQRKVNETLMTELVAKNPAYKVRPFDRERTKGFYTGLKTDTYNLLAKNLREQGKFDEAEKAYRASYAIKKNKNAALGVAKAAEKRGADAEALEYMTFAAPSGRAEPAEMDYFYSLYAKQHQGKTDGVDEYLDAEFIKTYRNPIKAEKYKPTSKRGDRTVLAEFITGAEDQRVPAISKITVMDVPNTYNGKLIGEKDKIYEWIVANSKTQIASVQGKVGMVELSKGYAPSNVQRDVYYTWTNFFSPSFLQELIQSKKLTYGGQEDVEGDLCNVVINVRTIPQKGLIITSFYWISTTTNLPRAVQSIELNKGKTRLVERRITSNLKIIPTVTPEVFNLKPVAADSVPMPTTVVTDTVISPNASRNTLSEITEKKLINAPMPNLDVLDLTYKPGKFSAYKTTGKITLVTFWATWCGPCLEEMPVFQKLVAKHPDKFQVLAVSAYGTMTDSIEYALKHSEYKFTFLLDPDWQLEKSRLGTLLGVFSLPTNILVDGDGKVIDYWSGGEEEPKLVGKIEKVISKK